MHISVFFFFFFFYWSIAEKHQSHFVHRWKWYFNQFENCLLTGTSEVLLRLNKSKKYKKKRVREKKVKQEEFTHTHVCTYIYLAAHRMKFLILSFFLRSFVFFCVFSVRITRHDIEQIDDDDEEEIRSIK